MTEETHKEESNKHKFYDMIDTICDSTPIIILPCDDRIEEIILKLCRETGLPYVFVRDEFDRIYRSEPSVPSYQIQLEKLEYEWEEQIFLQKKEKNVLHYRDIEFKHKKKRRVR